MPAVSGVWSCLHYPVPRGGSVPPGLGCFSVYAGLRVNPKSARETSRYFPSDSLLPPRRVPFPSKQVLYGGGFQDSLNPFLFPIFLHPKDQQQGLRQHKCHPVGCTPGCTAHVTQLLGTACARKTAPEHIVCRSCKPSPCKLCVIFIRGKTPLISSPS